MSEDGPWWSLDAARINHLQQDSIVALVKRCKAAHFVDVHVRINGKWEIHEADWLKHLTPRPRPILTTWRSFTYALGRPLARFKGMMRSRRNRTAVSGADDCGSQAMAANTRPDQATPEVQS